MSKNKSIDGLEVRSAKKPAIPNSKPTKITPKPTKAKPSVAKKAVKKPAKDIHGRGGNSENTTMKQLEEMLKKSHKKPELVMWFTDGYTNARPKRPKMIKHMIWVIYDNNNFEVSDDSRVIHIKSEDLGV